MSWAVTTYTCQRCQLERGDMHTWGTREYVLPTGVRLSMDWTLGWCMDCNSICAVELLDPDARQLDLKKAINELRTIGTQPSQHVDEQTVADWNHFAGLVQDAQDALGIAVTRAGRLVCLHCGGHHVSPWRVREKGDYRPFHPTCGGQMLASEDGLRFALKQTISRYTPEGKFIETVDVPGYSMPDGGYFVDRAEANAKIRGLWTATRANVEAGIAGCSNNSF